MKVAIDIQSVISNLTGVGRYTKELISAFSKLNISNDILLFYFNFLGKHKGFEGLRNKQIRCMPGRVYNKLWKTFGFPSINYFIGTFDVLHFPNFVMPPVKECKSIITVHDLAFMRFPQYIESKNLKFLRNQLPESLEKADKIIAVSQFTKQEIIDVFNIASEKIMVVYEGIKQFPDNKNNTDELNYLRDKLPDKYILFVGTIEPRKNIEGLIRAFNIANLNEYKLVIVGVKGWFYEGVFELVKELGLSEKVIFLGYVADDLLPQIYKNASLFVFPSFYEGFGLPPLEAMQYGVPVVASRVNEVLGESAYFIDPYKPEDVAEGIKDILENKELYNDLLVKGKQQAQKYSWENAANETMKIYELVSSN